MQHLECGNIAKTAPRNPRNSPSEQTDEAPGLIEKDRVDIERETPADERQGIERIERDDGREPAAFEE